MMRDDWHDDGWGPVTWIWMALMVLAFVALVAGLLIILARAHPRSRPDGPVPIAQHGVQILDERFARGEIDAEEYQQRRDLLRSG